MTPRGDALTASAGYAAELVAEPTDPPIGQERIRIRYEDGQTAELRLHDYARVYAIPGLYEQIVQGRLGCRSPAELARWLREGHEAIGIPIAQARILDIAAGNGVSGEALAAEGLTPVLGTDIVPQAREAALRDRPDVYGDYLTLDLLALTGEEQAVLESLRATAISCVAVVGERPGELPPAALAAAAGALGPDGLIVYMHDPRDGADVVGPALWRELVGPGGEAREMRRRRYLHRHTLNGGRFVLEGVVWRLRRRQAQ